MVNNTKLLENTFLDLVKIDSPSGHEDEVTSFIMNYLSALSITPILDTYRNVIATIDGQGERYFLSAHMDTVEPGRGVKPIVDGDIIKSDGTTILGADNKVGVALILTLLSHIATLEKKPSLDIVFTRSEEIGNYGAVNLDYSYITAKKGYTFDNPNPIGTIICASPFYNRFDITLHGKSAHASKPEEGIHTLPILTECMSQLKLGRVSATALVNIGALSAGHVRNTIMGEMEIHGEVRSMYENELKQYTNEITEVFTATASKYGAHVDIEVVTENGGYMYEETDVDLQRVVTVMNQHTITPVIRQDWGVADSNVFAEHGIKAINLGDGTVLTHTTNEHVKISDMVALQKIVVALITE
jgi:tripeptide aminopeptidase